MSYVAMLYLHVSICTRGEVGETPLHEKLLLLLLNSNDIRPIMCAISYGVTMSVSVNLYLNGDMFFAGDANHTDTQIFPHMVELLLQYEPSTYRTRWQALNHVNSLKVHGRLSKLWIEGGYHKLLANVIPPPPRMRRFFTAEEGEFIYKRALSRSVLADAECSSAGIGDGGGGSAKDDGGTEVLNRVSFPGAIDARAGTWSAWGQEDVGGDSRPEETAGKDQTNVET